MKFFDAKGASYPVLISQTVAGENLQTVLNSAKKKGQVGATLRQLHRQYTCEQILLAMLVHPEDGKPDNYQLLLVTTTDCSPPPPNLANHHHQQQSYSSIGLWGLTMIMHL